MGTAVRILATCAFACAVACSGKKDNGLRGESPTTGASPKISGFSGDVLQGQLLAVALEKSDGAASARFTVSQQGGSKILTVTPWPLDLPQCGGECSLEARRIFLPDGPEERLTITKGGTTIAQAVQQSRLQVFLPNAPFKVIEPKGRASSGRTAVELLVGEKTIARGKTTSLELNGQKCNVHLFDASVAGKPRPGIAEEAPPFIASWILVCR